jgi:hypothetical protein
VRITNPDIVGNLPIYPGCYFNVFFSGKTLPGRLVPDRAFISRWQEKAAGKNGALRSVAHLLLQGRDRPAVLWEKGFSLDGPYGMQIDVGSYEALVLVAQGDRIAGVLPLLAHVAGLKQATRKVERVDLVWMLERDDQFWTVADQLGMLRGRVRSRSSIPATLC